MTQLLGWIAVLGPLLAPQQAVSREEIWETAYRNSVRIGSIRTLLEPLEGKGLRATADMRLTFRRSSALVQVRMEQGTEESTEGKVTRVFMRQYQGDAVQVNLNGQLDADGRMAVDIDHGRSRRRLPWNEDVVSLNRRDGQFISRQPKPGDEWSQQIYEPIVNTVVSYHVRVKEPEEVPVSQSTAAAGSRRTLLRVELKPDLLVTGSGSLQLPTQVVWLDSTFVPVRRQIEMDGLGTILLVRSSRAEATAPINPASLPDINSLSLIPLARKIDRAYTTRQALYRITVRDDPSAVTALVQDEHQEIKALSPSTLELRVHPVKGLIQEEGTVTGGQEFLAPNYYINSDHARILSTAHEIVAEESDPWRKALRIERWVKSQMTVDSRAPLEPAGKILASRRGDCRHYAFLTTALCRAENIPARTAIGLIYTDKNNQGPAFGFHMWTEVLIQGHWRGLDATLGLGGVSATHLKVTHHSWTGTSSLTPLIPVNRVLGKLKMEVIQVE